MDDKKYLYILLDEEFKQPVIYYGASGGTLVTALAPTNVHAKDIMYEYYGDAIIGANILSRIVRFDIVLPRVEIYANDHDFGRWSTEEEINEGPIPAIMPTPFLDDPDK